MEKTDQITEPVQPQEGQGGGGTADAPYAEYLQRIPEEVRADVEPVFRDWDANVTRRFQEHAEHRQAWEPYEAFRESLGTPDHVQELLQLRDLLVNDPQQARDWWQSYAQANGLADEQVTETPATQEAVDFFATDQEQLNKLLEERLTPLQQRLEQYDARWEQQEHQARLAEAEQFVEGQIVQLEKDHPDEFSREAVERFIPQYLDSDPEHAVQNAFNDYRALVTQIERATLNGKARQPAPAESGGAADGAPEAITDLKQAGEIALQRLREANRA